MSAALASDLRAAPVEAPAQRPRLPAEYLGRARQFRQRLIASSTVCTATLVDVRHTRLASTGSVGNEVGSGVIRRTWRVGQDRRGGSGRRCGVAGSEQRTDHCAPRNQPPDADDLGPRWLQATHRTPRWVIAAGSCRRPDDCLLACRAFPCIDAGQNTNDSTSNHSPEGATRTAGPAAVPSSSTGAPSCGTSGPEAR